MKHSQHPHLTPSASRKQQDLLQPVQAIRQDTGETIWLVQSHTTPEHYYLLTVDQTTIQCLCSQFRYRGGCAHVGAVRNVLLKQAAASHSVACLEEYLPASQPTPRGYSHPEPRNEQERQQFEAAERRERAILWTDDRPFSVWK